MTTLEFSNQLIHLESRMERFALKLTYNREDAKDLVQETYLKALTHREQYVEVNNFKAWAFAIMKNSFINDHRRSVRKHTTFDNTKDLFFLNTAKVSRHIMPDSDLSNEEINHAIDVLADEYKIPFRMFIAGYKYKEIADILRLNLGTVKSRVFKCRKKLEKSLYDYQY